MQHPEHSLSEVKGAVKSGNYLILDRALAGAGRLGLGEDDICECITSLERTRNFQKILPDSFSLTQDVYKTRFEEHNIYIKLRINRAGKAVVISFKRDESPQRRYGQSE